jgi:hypothetical protein
MACQLDPIGLPPPDQPMMLVVANTAYPTGLPHPWTAELEAELPAELQIRD